MEREDDVAYEARLRARARTWAFVSLLLCGSVVALIAYGVIRTFWFR